MKGKIVEEKALYPPPKINLNALPLRSYFDKTITPTLLQALKMLAKERFYFTITNYYLFFIY